MQSSVQKGPKKVLGRLSHICPTGVNGKVRLPFSAIPSKRDLPPLPSASSHQIVQGGWKEAWKHTGIQKTNSGILMKVMKKVERKRLVS